MSISRYPLVSSILNVTPGSSASIMPAGNTIASGSYQIIPGVDYVIDNVRYDKDNATYNYFSASKTPYLLPFADKQFYTATPSIVVSPSAFNFVNNIFIGSVSNSNQIFTSTNGVNWTTRTTGFGATSVFTISYGNGLYVIAGRQARIMTSTDTITWTSRTPGVTLTEFWNASTYGTVHVLGSNGGFLSTSTDGITWTSRTPNVGVEGINSLAYGNSTYALGTSAASLRTSTDAITWTSRTGVDVSGFVMFVNGLFFAADTPSTGENGKLYSSTDAITWTLRFTNTSITSNSSQIKRIAYDGSRYFTCDQNGAGIVSTDGISWVLTNSVNNVFDSASINQREYWYGNSKYIMDSDGVEGIYLLERNTIDATLLVSDLGSVVTTAIV